MSLFTRILPALLVVIVAIPAKAVDIQEITSPGGITFWLVEEPSIPIVSLDMSFKGGARLDPEGKEGLSQMVTGLLDEGAGEMDAVAFSNAKRDLSARFGFGAGRDYASASAQVLVENLDASIALMATALHQPSFDPAAIERVRAQMLSSIAENETDPGAIASKHWFANMFPDSAYGRQRGGTAESVRALTREDLIAAMPRLFNRANVLVGIVGAVNPEEAGRMVDTLLGALPEGTPFEAEWFEAEPKPGIEVIDLDVPQSTAFFGHEAIKRTDPDFIPAFVMNYTLGGGSFNSRLTDEVREKRGLAYSVFSTMSVWDESAIYFGTVQTANESMAESLDIIRAEWARMAEDGVTQEELDKAKKYLTGAFPLRFDSNAKIAGYLVFMQEDDLGIDYLERRNALIEAVTLEDANRAAKRLLHPDRLAITVVGKPDGLAPSQ